MRIRKLIPARWHHHPSRTKPWGLQQLMGQQQNKAGPTKKKAEGLLRQVNYQQENHP